MPVREQASMGSTEFRAYSRRRKVKKEELVEKTSPVRDQAADCVGLKRGQCPSDDEPAKRLLSLELDVAEALADFWRMAHQPPQPHGFLQWSRKRKRTAGRYKDSMAPPLQPKEEPEDALSTVKKNRSSCALGRESCASDKDEIDSFQCSKESSSLFDSRAQSPSSPLPSLQFPCGTFLDGGNPDVKSAFQRVIPLLTVKTEAEDIYSERPAGGPQQVSARQKLKVCKTMGSKSAVKSESVDEHGAACLEELEVKPLAAEVRKVAGPELSKKPKCSLTEMEKEARRLRRIQANRESARQTIRKKQVLCEELTKKASSLAVENEDMKQKRDLLMQELFSLKGQNQNLKHQLETRSSDSLRHDLVESPLKMPSDPASLPALRTPSLPYAGVPPPAFFWAMAAAAAAANQAYTLNQQEMWDASSAAHHGRASLVLPGLHSHNQNIVSEVVEQSSCRASSGNSSPTLSELQKKERGPGVGVCTKSCTLPSEEPHHDSLHESAHPAKEFTTGDLTGKSSCEQTGCLLPEPTAASKSEVSSLPVIATSAKSMGCFTGPQIVQGAACRYMYGGNVAGYFKGNAHVTAMKGRNYYAAMVAAEARRRRKELTRSKFSRPRAVKPSAAS